MNNIENHMMSLMDNYAKPNITSAENNENGVIVAAPLNIMVVAYMTGPVTGSGSVAVVNVNNN